MKLRTRYILPEFWSEERISDCEDSSGLPIRLAFIALSCAADRKGRFKWVPDDVLDAMAEWNIVLRYEVQGVAYGQVNGFEQTQVLNNRESESNLPGPGDAEIPPVKDERRQIPPEVRAAIYKRDGDKCLRCENTDRLTIDHIFPVSMGGTNAVTNLRTLCRSCNSGRPVQGERLLADLAADGYTMADRDRLCGLGDVAR